MRLDELPAIPCPVPKNQDRFRRPALHVRTSSIDVYRGLLTHSPQGKMRLRASIEDLAPCRVIDANSMVAWETSRWKEEIERSDVARKM
jgi:hypothetical protein